MIEPTGTSLFVHKLAVEPWDRQEPWLQADEVAADAVCTLRTKKNELSVFAIRPDRSNLPRVFAALASQGDRWIDVGYVIIDPALLASQGFLLSQSEGKTPDDEVNALHYDIEQLDGRRLLQLAHIIQFQSDKARPMPDEVETWLRRGLMNGHLNRKRVNPKIIQKLEDKPK